MSAGVAGATASNDPREEARRLYRQSIQDGAPLTGAQLGERFRFTDRWGRLQIAACRDELDTGTDGVEPVEVAERDDHRNAGAHDRQPESAGEEPHVEGSSSRRARTERRESNGPSVRIEDMPGALVAPSHAPDSDDALPGDRDWHDRSSGAVGKHSANGPGQGQIGNAGQQIGNGREPSGRAAYRSPGHLGIGPTQIGTTSRQIGNTATRDGTPREDSGNGTTAKTSERKERADLPVSVNPVPHAMEPESVGDKARSAMTTLAVLLVAVVAGVASYDHQRVLAEQAGEGWRAWLWPLSVDGLVVAASMSMLTRRSVGQSAGVLTWVSMIEGVAASIAANFTVAEPTTVGRLVAVWPPLALLLSWELLLRNTGSHRKTQGSNRS